MSDFVELVRFNSSGLVPSIAQDFKSKQVLMLAWMSKDSLLKTLETGSAVYFQDQGTVFGTRVRPQGNSKS